MKKILLLLTLLAVTAYGATTFTTNFSFNKPGDGDRNYGQLIRDNWDSVDTALQAVTDSTTDHIADLTAAHTAASISTTVGAFSCTTQTDVQAYLDCLDGVLDPATSGIVLLVGAQTITGVKTFTTPPIFSSLPTSDILATDGAGTVTSTTFNAVDPLTTKGDITVHNGVDTTRLAVGTDDQIIVADSSSPEGIKWQNENPRWRKFTFTDSSFSAAATTFGVIAFQLATAEGVDKVIVKHNTAFTGGTLTLYSVEVGIAGDANRLAGAFDIFQAPAGTYSQITNITDVPDFSSTTDVTVTATSTGGNLDQASAGSVDVYVRTFVLP